MADTAPARFLVYGGGGAVTSAILASLALAKRNGEDIEINLAVRDKSPTTTALKEKGALVFYPETKNTNLKEPRKNKLVHVKPGDDYKIVEADKPKKHMDYIVLGVQATDLNFEELREFIGPNTRIVTMQNGVPIWLPATKAAQDHGIVSVDTADYGGDIFNEFGEKMIGGFTAAAASQLSQKEVNALCEQYPELKAVYGSDGSNPDALLPATSKMHGDYGYTFGNIFGAVTEKETRLVEILKKGELNVSEARDSETLLRESFLKLMGNATLNFIACLKDVSLKEIYETPELHEWSIALMEEVKAVAVAMGVDGTKLDSQRRAKNAGGMPHKTSTHTAIYGGKAAEIDALLRSVIDLGRDLHVPTPLLDKLYEDVIELAAKKDSAYTRPEDVLDKRTGKARAYPSRRQAKSVRAVRNMRNWVRKHTPALPVAAAG